MRTTSNTSFAMEPGEAHRQMNLTRTKLTECKTMTTTTATNKNLCTRNSSTRVNCSTSMMCNTCWSPSWRESARGIGGGRAGKKPEKKVNSF